MSKSITISLFNNTSRCGDKTDYSTVSSSYYKIPVITCLIFLNNRIISALCKHIVADKTLSRAGKLVGIDESADLGVVISALEVVESGL